MFVDLRAPKGELRVAVLDQDGKPIASLGRADWVATQADKMLVKVEWRNRPELANLAGKPVKFRFYLKNGALYSFWVSPDANGASRGYVAAGGPGFTGATDTVGELGYRAASKF